MLAKLVVLAVEFTVLDQYLEFDIVFRTQACNKCSKLSANSKNVFLQFMAC